MAVAQRHVDVHARPAIDREHLDAGPLAVPQVAEKQFTAFGVLAQVGPQLVDDDGDAAGVCFGERGEARERGGSPTRLAHVRVVLDDDALLDGHFHLVSVTFVP